MSTQLEQHTVEHHGGTTGTVVGEEYYVIGGNNSPFEHFGTVHMVPYGARHGAACSLDGVIYYCGGWTAGPNKGTFQKSLIAFEPQSGKVQKLADMPASRTARSENSLEGSGNWRGLP
ncbi:Kelch repeat-containing protein [Gimesia fumaroli]|uniref:Kelch motif protein n=1 Tax=Gimesia fumaroli TaxID=2527976 RepID=A0A518I9W8_9PLAN|nr:hypothetical protein [Gimesia fumaroli]QDV49854.1 Kelch motif protein [Gimesia fumaroli]